MQSTIYNLPTIEFVAGSEQDLSFNVYRDGTNTPFSLTDCSARFSVVEFANKSDNAVVSKNMTASAPTGTAVINQLSVTLLDTETKSMCGKYVYQISIKDDDNKTEIPGQGLMYVTRNIDKSFITG